MDTAVVGAFAFIVLVLLLTILSGLIVTALRERAWQRRKEAEYAAAWAATHRQHQDHGRYLTDDPQRPE